MYCVLFLLPLCNGQRPLPRPKKNVLGTQPFSLCVSPPLLPCVRQPPPLVAGGGPPPTKKGPRDSTMCFVRFSFCKLVSVKKKMKGVDRLRGSPAPWAGVARRALAWPCASRLQSHGAPCYWCVCVCGGCQLALLRLELRLLTTCMCRGLRRFLLALGAKNVGHCLVRATKRQA
jgi:hypothetical protein